MSKKRFVQHIIIRSLPKTDELNTAIHYAERLWDGLSQAGYGHTQESGPRESVNWYQRLNNTQRQGFDRFWDAYNYKKDRNGAAMRWYQLGELSKDQAQFIILAAEKDAQKQLPPGQARKMAQGWLHEQRYNDYLPNPKNLKQRKAQELMALNTQLTGLKRLYEACNDKALIVQIEQLEQKIKHARA